MESATPRATIDTVVRVPIGSIIVDPNIRRDTKMKPGFAASVKQHGVLEPVDAYQDDTLAWHLQDGQLRYLAAVDAGLPDIPVLVNDPELAEAAKYIKQLVKNEQRAELSDAERADAWQTLFDLGVSADSIAKKTNRPRKTVEAALQVKQSPYATELLEAGIGLDQAATLLEFEGNPEVIERLTDIAVNHSDEFNYAVEEARAEAALENERLNLIGQLAEQNITVVAPDVTHPTLVPLEQVYLDADYKTFATKEDVPSAALRATVRPVHGYVDNEWKEYYKVAYYLDDSTEHGLFIKPSTPSGRAPMTEAESADRKRTIANNKAWPIAATVRQKWINEELLAATRKLPSDVDVFIAHTLAGSHPSTKPGNAARIALALAIGRAEASASQKEAWRGRGMYSDGTELTKLARYLEQLAAWGHNLSDVEKEIITEGKKASK
jgi:ParB family chromosome partitioning protein